MNNDLEQFSEERLMQMERALSIGSLDDRPTMDEMLKITRIALSVKQAKPVAFIADCGTIIGDGDRFFDDYKNPQPLYTTPQPAPTEQVIPDGWKLVPIEPTIEMREAFHNSYEDFENCIGECPDSQWKAMIAAAPKPESEL